MSNPSTKTITGIQIKDLPEICPCCSRVDSKKFMVVVEHTDGSLEILSKTYDTFQEAEDYTFSLYENGTYTYLSYHSKYFSEYTIGNKVQP